MPKHHTWSFFRAGGMDQVALRNGEDLANLRTLDQKLWVALACPTKGTEIDERMLDLIDADRDGRVRPPELLGAIDWSCKVFGKLDLFLGESSAKVALAEFDSKSDEGKRVLSSAKRILKETGKKESKEVTLDDVLAMEKALSSTRLNGDGVVPAASCDDEATRKVITEILEAVGAVDDRSGQKGVDLAHVEQFFTEAAAAIAWYEDGASADTRPIGDATSAAAAAVEAVEAKVDDFFARCDLAAFDPRAAVALGAIESDLVALGARTIAISDAEVRRLPLSKVASGASLPLGTQSVSGLNPGWLDAMRGLAAAAVTPLLGARDVLDARAWGELKAKLAAHRAWAAKRPGTKTVALGAERLRDIVGSGARGAITTLISDDAALAPEFEAIALVEKAVRYRASLARLARNFVNFSDFYQGRGASFQAGTLYLDARSCALVVYVASAAKHAALAGLSSAYLAYCDITRVGEEKRSIVAAFTAGDVDDLMVGRNGVFYDRAGRDWDATITSIIENPISVRQAFWAPYKRVVRLVEEQVAKRAAEKEKESSARMDGVANKAANADAHVAPAPAAPAPAAAPAAPAPPAAEPKKLDVGMLAAIGLVVTGIAGFFTAMIGTLLGLGIWMPLAFLGLLLAISGPSMLIAWLKLRKRNLGRLLDANGWAVNSRAKVNVAFGTTLTVLAKLPDGASRALEDPYADKPVKWKRWVALGVLLAALVLWATGTVDRWLPDAARSSKVLPSLSPSTSASAPAAPAPSAAPAP